MSDRDLDRELVDAARSLFGEWKGGKASRGLRGLPRSPIRSKELVPDAKSVRLRVKGIARRMPEVMVKISGSAKSLPHFRAHLAYISRNGQIELEDQDFQKASGRQELGDVLEDWMEGVPMPREAPVQVDPTGEPSGAGRRQTFNLVLSMPSGTSELGLKRAVRDFAQQEFSGHQYVMAMHTPTTDPDPAPSPHPHIHLTVKAVSLSGRRLNPRKTDLQRWREVFAEKLRDNGVDAVATKRQVRLQRQPGERQELRHLRSRHEDLTRRGRRMPLLLAAARNTETTDKVLKAWRQIVDALKRSNQPSDRALSVDLEQRLSGRVAGEQKLTPVRIVRSRQTRERDA